MVETAISQLLIIVWVGAHKSLRNTFIASQAILISLDRCTGAFHYSINHLFTPIVLQRIYRQVMLVLVIPLPDSAFIEYNA